MEEKQTQSVDSLMTKVFFASSKGDNRFMAVSVCCCIGSREDNSLYVIFRQATECQTSQVSRNRCIFPFCTNAKRVEKQVIVTLKGGIFLACEDCGERFDDSFAA